MSGFFVIDLQTTHNYQKIFLLYNFPLTCMHEYVVFRLYSSLTRRIDHVSDEIH